MRKMRNYVARFWERYRVEIFFDLGEERIRKGKRRKINSKLIRYEKSIFDFCAFVIFELQLLRSEFERPEETS